MRLYTGKWHAPSSSLQEVHVNQSENTDYVPKNWTGQWQWHTQRSPTSVKWRPGLTSKSVGVTTPQKRICCADEASSFGKERTNPLIWTVCSALSPEMDSEKRKQTRPHTGCCWYEFTNSDLWILGFGARRRIRQGSQEGDKQAKDTRKKQTPEEEVADTVAHQSLLFPNLFFLLSYEEFVLRRPHPL